MWKYVPVLNVMIQILVTIGLGGIMGKLGIFNAKDFVPLTVRFVFYVALPCLVIQGLGIGINFYSENNIWAYIIAFLLLRVIALVVGLLLILASNWRRKERHSGLGDVVVIWLCLTWISTVIMGVPISSAIFGDGALGQKYGILAAISSFIFQLPLMLVFLEAHALDRDRMTHGSGHTEELNRDSLVTLDERVETVTNGDTELVAAISQHTDQSINDNNKTSLEIMESALSSTKEPFAPPPVTEQWWQLTGGRYVNRRDVWIDILKRVLRNPVLWGIAIGFVLTLSTVGPTYLNPGSPDFVQGLGWIQKP
jgi:predicted permease